MNNKMKTIKVKIIHLSQYDEDEVYDEYTRVIVDCPEHGLHLLPANIHLIRRGCSKCLQETNN